MDAKANKQIEIAFTRLMFKLVRVHHRMQVIGETDMGLLHSNYAKRFHRITAELGKLIEDLEDT